MSSVRLRSAHLDWHGPTVTLWVDLPAPPLRLPEEWAVADTDTVQGQLQFLAVGDLELDTCEARNARIFRTGSTQWEQARNPRRGVGRREARLPPLPQQTRRQAPHRSSRAEREDPL
ncbi:Imm50 family immunity protein [Streptomyces rubiginosohelvolus]|uniref:Imm50 family immunity protein n=1 Tax=Streptomyces rubiginosohelvolus TaxID=67362 RepID=UPI00371F2A22